MQANNSAVAVFDQPEPIARVNLLDIYECENA